MNYSAFSLSPIHFESGRTGFSVIRIVCAKLKSTVNRYLKKYIVLAFGILMRCFFFTNIDYGTYFDLVASPMMCHYHIHHTFCNTI